MPSFRAVTVCLLLGYSYHNHDANYRPILSCISDGLLVRFMTARHLQDQSSSPLRVFRVLVARLDTCSCGRLVMFHTIITISRLCFLQHRTNTTFINQEKTQCKHKKNKQSQKKIINRLTLAK